MKSNVKKFASIFLAAVMLFSMCALFSVSAAESTESVGTGLTVTATSNYCSAPAAATYSIGDTVVIAFSAPTDLNMVDIQWGMDYDKTMLKLTQSKVNTKIGSQMKGNTNAKSYCLMGSASNDATPYELSQGEAIMTFTFKALADGQTDVSFTVNDLMNRTDNGDVILVNNNVVAGEDSDLTVHATSNFFASKDYTIESISQYQDTNGDVFVTVEYKLCAEDMYLIHIDVDELTYDPAVLEWKQEYNTYGSGRSAVVDMFPFAAEDGLGAGTVHQTAPGRLVGNFSAIKPAAYASTEDGEAVTAVKATFKVLNKKAGETTVKCDIDTLSFCETSERFPYHKYIAIDKKVVNATEKAKAEYSTVISTGKAAEALIGDVDKNGVIEINDVTMLTRYLAEFIDFVDPTVSDVTGDGVVDVRDVTEIQRYLAQLITSFD